MGNNRSEFSTIPMDRGSRFLAISFVAVSLSWMHVDIRAEADARIATADTEIISSLWAQIDRRFAPSTGFRLVGIDTIPMKIVGNSANGALTITVEARPETLIPLFPKYYDRIAGSLVIVQKGFRAAGVNPAEPRDDRVGVAGEVAANIMQNVGPALLAMDPDRMTLLDEGVQSPSLSAELSRIKTLMQIPQRTELERYVSILPVPDGTKQNLIFNEFQAVLAPILETEIGDKLWLADTKSALELFEWQKSNALVRQAEGVAKAVVSLAEVAGPYSDFISKLGVRNSGLRFEIQAPFTVKFENAKWNVDVNLSALNSDGVIACQEFQAAAKDWETPDTRREAVELRKRYDSQMAKVSEARAAVTPAINRAVRAAIEFSDREQKKQSESGNFTNYVPKRGLYEVINASLEGTRGPAPENPLATRKPYDLVELTAPTPLDFLGKALRVGAVGERFQVIQVRPAEKRIFLLTTDVNGKQIGVSVDQSSARLVDSGENQIAQKLRVLAGEDTTDRAMSFLAEVALNRPDLVGWKRMQALGTQLAIARQNSVVARKNATTAQNEAKRMWRNADIADHPSGLGIDASRVFRAEEIRTNARQFEDAAERYSEQARSIESQISQMEAEFREFPNLQR